MQIHWNRYSDLYDRGIVRNRTTLYRWIKQGLFPSGTMIGPNTRAWTDAEIEIFEAGRARASAEDEPAADIGDDASSMMGNNNGPSIKPEPEAGTERARASAETEAT